MLQVDDTSELENLEIFERPPEDDPETDTRSVVERVRENPRLWQGKVAPAFWTITGTLSLIVNIILIIILVMVGRELFALKGLISDQLIGGLYNNFVLMDTAVIDTTVTVNDTIQVVDTITVEDSMPVVFELAIDQETAVELSEDTPIDGAVVNINTPFFSVTNAPANIILPKGTILSTHLDMTVPVSQTIPINLQVPVSLDVPVTLEVPVSIPLDETDLHEPFVGLQGVLNPYQSLLGETPDSWGEAACTAGPVLCWMFGDK